MKGIPFFETINTEAKFDFIFSKANFIGGTIIKGKYKYFFVYPLNIIKFEKYVRLTIDEFKEAIQSLAASKSISLYQPQINPAEIPGFVFIVNKNITIEKLKEVFIQQDPQPPLLQ